MTHGCRALAVAAELAAGRDAEALAAAPAESVLPYTEGFDFSGLSVAEVLEYIAWVDPAVRPSPGATSQHTSHKPLKASRSSRLSHPLVSIEVCW